MTNPEARALDHCVLSVADLDVARARFLALGFTVAPDGVHPFGTANACVHFADGSFFEPLALADPERASQAARAGNVFVARDLDWRGSERGEGLTAVVFSSDNAEVDGATFVATGISAGLNLDFERKFATPDGQVGEASFRLAFAAAGDSFPFFFTCERAGQPAVDRSSLIRHGNGALGIRAVALGTSARDVLEVAAAASFADTPSDGSIALRDGVTITGGAIASITVAVNDIERTEAALAASGTGDDRSGRTLHVAPAPGQPVALLFQEERS